MAQSITEVYYPKFIQGVGSGNAADDRKVPYACRMTVSGLTANTTYRCYNKFVTDPTLTDNGQGNYIIVDQATGTFTRVTSASLASAGRYKEFTTNASGSYTGWFISEPTIATTHFQPGIQIYFRLMLNDGAGGAFVNSRVTATNFVTVLGFGSTPTAGTGIRGAVSAVSVPKNFIMLYDNIGATGRPVTGTFVEDDATEESVANGYAPFYANNVDGINNTWGAIIPNNLANGINNISQYSLANASLISTCLSVNGVFGTTNTSNASGGLTELVLNTSCSTLPVSLLTFTGIAAKEKAKLVWTTASEINFSSFSIERSKDGRVFNSIGSKRATGDNSVYNYEDDLLPGLSFYRLKMIDNDGQFSYSDQVKFSNNNTIGLTISPNPVVNELTLSHPQAKSGAIVQVYTVTGQRIFTKNIALNATQTNIDVAVLTSGIYLLKYTNNNEERTVRFKK